MKIDNLLFVEAMALSNLEVRNAVPRCDSHNAGAEVRVDRFILDDGSGDGAVDPFGFKCVAMSVLGVPLVVGVWRIRRAEVK